MAAEDVLDEVETQKNKYLCFNLGSGEYAIPIRYVVEIINIQPITRVPDVPDYVKGVVNLRGKVIPVVDVRVRFALRQREYDERTCIIVVYLNDIQVGLIVDAVTEVLNIDSQQIERPPEVGRKRSRFIEGLAKFDSAVKMIVNMNTILYDETSDEESVGLQLGQSEQ